MTFGKVVLNLVGLDGNAFVILGAFREAARHQHLSPSWIEDVCREAMTGDYDHLLYVISENCTPEDLEVDL